MSAPDVALVARARGLRTHLLSRETLATLCDITDVASFAGALARVGSPIDPVDAPGDVIAIERAIARTTGRYLNVLYRWQADGQGTLDVFAAYQDRRSLRALLRGAAQGAPSRARIDGLVPTPSLPQRALADIARSASPAESVARLLQLGHPDGRRLLPCVRKSQPDLLAIDVALLRGFAQRAAAAAARSDATLRAFTTTLTDIGNAQNALLIAGDTRDLTPADLFVEGGRWLSRDAFVAVARAGSEQLGLTALSASVARSPLRSLLPVVASDVVHLDRTFLTVTLRGLARTARIEPLGTAPLLLVLLLVDAQHRDLRSLAWGALLSTPAAMRLQQLVTPS